MTRPQRYKRLIAGRCGQKRQRHSSATASEDDSETACRPTQTRDTRHAVRLEGGVPAQSRTKTAHQRTMDEGRMALLTGSTVHSRRSRWRRAVAAVTLWWRASGAATANGRRRQQQQSIEGFVLGRAEGQFPGGSIASSHVCGLGGWGGEAGARNWAQARPAFKQIGGGESAQAAVCRKAEANMALAESPAWQGRLGCDSNAREASRGRSQHGGRAASHGARGISRAGADTSSPAVFSCQCDGGAGCRCWLLAAARGRRRGQRKQALASAGDGAWRLRRRCTAGRGRGRREWSSGCLDRRRPLHIHSWAAI
ncbi:hypothetical protein B0J12DRAFT_237245 [Macrophomina phaseolina]|uniref:Uncharacterized protein n=1 Tax=Macrophomina phaseolina TaxID=35725 RepID=A0ABQ8GQX1_9PEZI|nr:hypothetical protein B0J12DRAFT_237245 [Macrophomina phaseolina]